MDVFLLGAAVVAAGGVIALVLAMAGATRAGIALATASVLLGAILSGAPALAVLRGAPPIAGGPCSWLGLDAVPVTIDRLSAFFVLTILVVGAASAVYGAGYLEHYRGRKELGPVLLLFNALLLAMLGVVTTSHALAFLAAWELMTLAAYLLVCFEDERPEVRRAGIVYLAITHVGTTFVIAFFLLLSNHAGSFAFDRIRSSAPDLTPLRASVVFLCGLLGFGIKAGVWPLHVWLPVAHPVAPSHVSAVMSGVIVKTAIYALIRGTSLLGPPPPWWGIAVVILGASSGVLGVLYALAQHDLKRLLAYHTIENVGIILIGVGTGLIGLAYRAPAVAALGFAGGILHVLNHAIFKSLLFFGAGSVLQATHAREIEQLGGLARRMPWTAATFLVGAVAICGLPPLNGFVSEWLVFAGLFRAALDLPGSPAFVEVAALASLALVGGLAAACFAKAFGIVFLGTGRSDATDRATECRPTMRIAMVALALACAAIGLQPRIAGGVTLEIASDLLTAAGVPADLPAVFPAGEALRAVGVAAAAFLGTAVALALLRAWLLSGRPVEAGATWGCGYPFPTPRMQYTASSFADPLVKLAATVLRPSVHDHPPRGYFPSSAARETHVDDVVNEHVFEGGARQIARVLVSLRWVQQGRIQLYLLYILLTVVSLLLWQLGEYR